MSSALTTKVRLVSCPNCLQLLPELPDLHFCRCGKCGAIKVRELESLPLLGSHYDHSYYDNNDYDDQHYQTTFQGSVDSNPIVHPLASISPHADTDYDVLANLLPIELDIDSAGSDDFDPRVSTDYDDSGNLASAVRSFGSNPPGSVAINIGLQVENNDPHHRTSVTSVEFIFILVGFILEMLSAGFDQVSSASEPLYALISLLLAIAAVLTCILELIYNGIKDKDASPNRPVFGTLLAIFGLGLAVIQCVCSAVQYYFLHQHASNPMKLSPLPFFFFICLVVFKLKGN